MVNYPVLDETVQYFRLVLEQEGLHSYASKLWGEVRCTGSARAVLDTINNLTVPTHLIVQKNQVTSALRLAI